MHDLFRLDAKPREHFKVISTPRRSSIRDTCDDDMRVDHSDVTASTRKWLKKVGDLPNKAQKLPCGPPGFLGLFILCVIVMWWALEPIKLLHFRNVWSTRFSFFVYFSANGAKKCGPPSFLLIQKTGWTNHFFHAFFVRSAAIYGHFWVDAVTSEPSTCIPSSHRLYSWYNN